MAPAPTAGRVRSGGTLWGPRRFVHPPTPAGWVAQLGGPAVHAAGAHVHAQPPCAHVFSCGGQAPLPVPAPGDRCPAGTAARQARPWDSRVTPVTLAQEAEVSGQHTGHQLSAGQGWAIVGHRVTGPLVTWVCRWHLVGGWEVPGPTVLLTRVTRPESAQCPLQRCVPSHTQHWGCRATAWPWASQNHFG